MMHLALAPTPTAPRSVQRALKPFTLGALAAEMRTLAARNLEQAVPHTCSGTIQDLTLLGLKCHGDMWTLRIYHTGTRPRPQSAEETRWWQQVARFREYFSVPPGASVTWDEARGGYAVRITWRELAVEETRLELAQ